MGAGFTTEIVFGLQDDDAILAPEFAVVVGHWVGTIPWLWVGTGLTGVAVAVAARAMATLTSGRTAVRVPFPELSDREREVLDLLARGYDNATIARRMVLSPKTVRNHVSNVLTKLGVPDRAQAMIRARDEGLGVS
jgi:DNA-binding CsgD family transcriptional regulator